MPDDSHARRAALLAGAAPLAVAGADLVAADLATLTGDLQAAGLVPSRATDVAARVDVAYVLGWLDPGLLGLVGAAAVDANGDIAAVDCATVLGLTRRLNDLTAATLFDDPRAEASLHQMVAARLADLLSTADTLEAGLDRYASAPSDAAIAFGLLALALEVAFEAGETALLATDRPEARPRIERRRTWLTNRFAGCTPLVLLDTVAAAVVGSGP